MESEQAVNAVGPPDYDHNPWAYDNELGFDEQDNIDIHNVQQVAQMRQNRDARALQVIGDETWYSCFSVPTPEWK